MDICRDHRMNVHHWWLHHVEPPYMLHDVKKNHRLGAAAEDQVNAGSHGSTPSQAGDPHHCGGGG